MDRTQAIQRLRSDWTRVDPVAEAKVIHLDRQRELRRLKRVSFGDGLAERIAAATIRQLARHIEDLNARIAELEAEIVALSTSTATQSTTCSAPATKSPPR